MRTREISPDRWAVFLERFNAYNRGRRVHLQLIGRQPGAQSESADLPFFATALQASKSSQSLTFLLGEPGPDQVAHRIDAPVHLLVEEEDDGWAQTLLVEDGRGPVARLRLD